MAVLINEVEVAPAPAPRGQASPQPSQDSSDPSPQLLREVEREAQTRQRRLHRLTAY